MVQEGKYRQENGCEKKKGNTDDDEDDVDCTVSSQWYRIHLVQFSDNRRNTVDWGSESAECLPAQDKTE